MTWYLHCYTDKCAPGFPANTYHSRKISDVLDAAKYLLAYGGMSGITRVEISGDVGRAQVSGALFAEQS